MAQLCTRVRKCKSKSRSKWVSTPFYFSWLQSQWIHFEKKKTIMQESASFRHTILFRKANKSSSFALIFLQSNFVALSGACNQCVSDSELLYHPQPVRLVDLVLCFLPKVPRGQVIFFRGRSTFSVNVIVLSDTYSISSLPSYIPRRKWELPCTLFSLSFQVHVYAKRRENNSEEGIMLKNGNFGIMWSSGV